MIRAPESWRFLAWAMHCTLMGSDPSRCIKQRKSFLQELTHFIFQKRSNGSDFLQLRVCSRKSRREIVEFSEPCLVNGSRIMNFGYPTGWVSNFGGEATAGLLTLGIEQAEKPWALVCYSRPFLEFLGRRTRFEICAFKIFVRV